MTTFAITILGCGASLPLLSRNPSAQVVNVHEKLFLLDCAEATQLQLRKYRVKFQRIQHILISHLHGDHYYGLIGFLMTNHLLGRQKELHLYAHKELKEVMEMHLRISQTELRYPLIYHDFDPEKHQVIYDAGDMQIEAFPLEHNFPASGFIFREEKGRPNIDKDFIRGRKISHAEIQQIKSGEDYTDPEGRVFKNEEITLPSPEPRSYAYCSDTAYHEPIIPYIEGVTLLYHESTFMQDMAEAAREKFHATASEAATIAKKARVKRLLLGHYSARYRNLDEMRREAAEIFPETILADDGKVILLPQEPSEKGVE